METYKTVSISNKENEVQQFIGQYDDVITLVVVNNKEYSIDTIEDLKEMEEDFFFEYGKNENTIKAFNLLVDFLCNENVNEESNRVISL